MTNILSFILGGLIIFFFIDINTRELKNVWQHAYQVGRDDGETLARSQYELTHEQLEAKCMFFYATPEYERKR
jgi:hypothetical protein